jgi:hypothetical protein
MKKVYLNFEFGQGYWLDKKPSYGTREVEISDEDYDDYFELERRLTEWHHRLDAMWKEQEGKA